MARSDSAPTRKVVGAPDAKGVARAQTKPRKSGNVPLREVSPPLYNLIFYALVARSDRAPTLKVVGAPDAKTSHERRQKSKKAATFLCAKYPRRFYNLIFYVPVVESIVRGNDTHTAQSVYFALILR